MQNSNRELERIVKRDAAVEALIDDLTLEVAVERVEAIWDDPIGKELTDYIEPDDAAQMLHFVHLAALGGERGDYAEAELAALHDRVYRDMVDFFVKKYDVQQEAADRYHADVRDYYEEAV
ncbi:MAG: hypothetical protein FWF41_05375 [Betaproteobacteria bacterium]|nr:hypothetical protein [Betaproteobacteria bacterium]